MVILGRFFVKVRIAIMWCRSFVSFHLRRVFCNVSPSLCGGIYVDGYHRFLLLKVYFWRAVYFYPKKEVLSYQIPKNYEILLTASALHFLLWEKTKFNFAGSMVWNVDKRRRITTSNFIIKLFVESKPPNIVE